MTDGIDPACATSRRAPAGNPHEGVRPIGRRRSRAPVLGGACIAAALIACHHVDAPAPAAPEGPTACARASDSMVAAMLARLPKADPPPTEEADAIRNLIRERCERDGWSAEATRCLIAMKRTEDAEPCEKFLTEDQQAALVGDEEARFGAARGHTAPSAGSGAPAPGE